MSVQTRMQSIIDKANATTGKADKDLTTATQSLVDGFGGGENPTKYMTSFTSAFAKTIFPDGANVVIDITSSNLKDDLSMFRWMFASTKGKANVIFKGVANDISRVLIDIFNGSEASIVDFGETNINASSLATAFSHCLNLTEVRGKIRTTQTTSLLGTFGGCPKLVRVEPVLDLSNCQNTNSTFYQCYALEHIRFVPLSIKTSIDLRHPDNLSPDSVQSIIDGLADLSATTAQTLTLDRTAVLSESQKTAISAKNWTLVQ